MIKYILNNKRFVAFTVLIAVIFALHWQGKFLSGVDELGRADILKHNHEFIQEARKSSLETFLTLSALKASLALVESSDAGISFIVNVNVQIGKLVGAINDIVHYGWALSFLGLTVLPLIELTLHSANYLTDILFHIFLFSSLFHIFVSFAFPHHRLASARFLEFALQGSLGLYILLPLAVYFTSFVSEALIQDKKELASIGTKIHLDKLEEISTDESIKNQATQGLNNYYKLTKDLEDTHESLTRHITEHIAVVLFEAIAFPLLFLYLLMASSRPLTSTLFR